MPDFGNEFIIESYKIPWLIWIQLLVTILLIILLFFGLSIFTSDASPSSASASTSSGAAAAATPNHLNKPSSSQRRTKVEVQGTRRNEETRTEFIREEDQSGEESSSKDSTFFTIFRHPNHPCNYFGLAKRAFLKCLGLDSNSELSRSHEHDKQE